MIIFLIDPLRQVLGIVCYRADVFEHELQRRPVLFAGLAEDSCSQDVLLPVFFADSAVDQVIGAGENVFIQRQTERKAVISDPAFFFAGDFPLQGAYVMPAAFKITYKMRADVTV